MKRSHVPVLAVVLLLITGLGIVWLLAPRPVVSPPVPPRAEEQDTAEVPLVPLTEGSGAPPTANPGSSSEEETGPRAGHSVPGETPPASVPDPAAGVASTGSETGDADRPAVRRNPRDPPPPSPNVRPLGKRPPFGPTGMWEKFPPAIPRGTATARVRVVDRDGTPLAGADVWLGPPDIRGDAAVSYAHLRKLGQADEKGYVTAERLPAGRAALAGNLTGLLNGPRGLDARSAVAITLESDRTVEAELTLPFSVAAFGRVTGTVRGPGGEPLKNAQVFVGYFRVRTAADGIFTIPWLAPGAHTLSITRSGYLAHGEPVSLPAGETVEVEVSLQYRESGSLSLAGTVTGPAGEPVPEATVYVIAIGGGASGTVRSARTDEHGRYAMDALPDRLSKSKVRIQASRVGYQAANEVLNKGIRSPEIDLRLPVKLTKLSLTVLDAATGAPLDRCRFEARKEGETRPSASFSSRSETGVYERWIEAGKYVCVVEAPDHESLGLQMTVPEGGAGLEYTARLVGTRDVAVEVALTVVVVSAISGDPIETAKVEVMDAAGSAVIASLESRREGGRFTLPAPSGRKRIRVTAPGHEVFTTDVDLKHDEAEREIEARLTPQ